MSAKGKCHVQTTVMYFDSSAIMTTARGRVKGISRVAAPAFLSKDSSSTSSYQMIETFSMHDLTFKQLIIIISFFCIK